MDAKLKEKRLELKERSVAPGSRLKGRCFTRLMMTKAGMWAAKTRACRLMQRIYAAGGAAVADAAAVENRPPPRVCKDGRSNSTQRCIEQPAVSPPGANCSRC